MPLFPVDAGVSAGRCRVWRRGSGWVLPLLALAALALACDDGSPDPVFVLAGGNSAGSSGRGGRGGSGAPASRCLASWPAYVNWADTFESSEYELFSSLNAVIGRRGNCADEPFSREKFVQSDEARCWSRQRAHWEYSTRTWGRAPPDLTQHAPWPTNQLVVSVTPLGRPSSGRPTDAADAVEKFLDNPASCTLLKASKYRAIGVGRDGTVWVLTLAEESN